MSLRSLGFGLCERLGVKTNYHTLSISIGQVVNIANDQRTLKEIENKILYMLANASGKREPAAGTFLGILQQRAMCRELYAPMKERQSSGLTRMPRKNNLHLIYM